MLILLCILTLTSSLSLFCSKPAGQKSPSEKAKDHFSRELATLQTLINNQFDRAVEERKEQQIRTAFLASRKQFKKIEYYLEYFFPSTSVLINGAPIDEIELGENRIQNPTGFQVMEELIYEEPTTGNRAELRNEIKKMQLNLERVARYNEEYNITDAQLFDAARLEVFRIISLGITGFDTPVALQSLPEAAAALEGIRDAFESYEDAKLAELFNTAIKYVNKNNEFNTFDRLTFITEHLQPISSRLNNLRKELKVGTVASSSALHNEATSLFQENAFNLNKFVSNHTEYTSKEKVALGKQLFNSTLLSNGGNRSCASCHREEKAFTDGFVKAQGISADRALLRNTPTLLYAGLQRGFFYDLKAGTLEDQALDVVHNRDEMDGSLEEAAMRINKEKAYEAAFASAFDDLSGKATPWRIQHALASYIRSLSPFSSRLDKYMRGDKKQLTDVEKSGFNLFMGKAKCGSCHFAPLFNGTQAPMFTKSEAEVLGVPARPDTVNASIDNDLGRYALNAYPQYKFAFKTTSLRNITKTAPYMHNGVYNTLEEVLDFYNRGGGAGIGIELENQTLSSDPLNLTKKEMGDIISFLKTLDDE